MFKKVNCHVSPIIEIFVISCRRQPTGNMKRMMLYVAICVITNQPKVIQQCNVLQQATCKLFPGIKLSSSKKFCRMNRSFRGKARLVFRRHRMQQNTKVLQRGTACFFINFPNSEELYPFGTRTLSFHA